MTKKGYHAECTITHMMADGTVVKDCDLEDYEIDVDKISPVAKRIIAKMMRGEYSTPVE